MKNSKLILLLTLGIFFTFTQAASAADRYWVGGTASWDGTAGSKWSTTSGGAGGEAIPTSGDSCYFDAASGAVTVTIAAGNTGCGDVNFTGFTGTLAGSAALTISGSLTLDGTMTNSYTGTLTFASTGAETITSDGVAFDSSLTFNGVGGSWTLQDDLETGSTRTITVTNGTFDANDFDVTTGLFASSNSNTRTIDMGDGQWELTGNNGIVWSMGTGTNLTFTRSALPVNLSYSGGTGTRSWAAQGLTEDTVPSVNVTAGTDIIQAGSGSKVDNLDFTGFTGVFFFSSSGIIIYGDLTLDPGMTYQDDTNGHIFAATSGTQTITTNGVATDGTWMVGVPGDVSTATVILADDLSLDGSFVLRNGTFDANDKNITLTNSSNAAFFATVGVVGTLADDPRTLYMGSGTWTVLNWNCTTGEIDNAFPETSTVVLKSGNNAITCSNTFYNLTKTASAASTLTFTANTRQTIQGTLTLEGVSEDARLSLRSSSAGTQWHIDPQGRRIISAVDVMDSYNVSYTDITYSSDSLDSGNNRGWTLNETPTPGVSGGYSGSSGGSSGNNNKSSDLSSLIATIQAQIAQLQAQILQMKGQTSSEITRDLKLGMQGEDVRQLQVTLNRLGFTVAQTGPGSVGQETDFFGELTHSAVIRLQEANAAEILTPVGLTAGTGLVGPSTRAWLQGK